MIAPIIVHSWKTCRDWRDGPEKDPFDPIGVSFSGRSLVEFSLAAG
jgi:hypothetical protein